MSRNMVFTLFFAAPSDAAEVESAHVMQKLQALATAGGKNAPLALRAQLERGEEGALHIQGCVKYKSNKRFQAFGNELVAACGASIKHPYLAPMRGTPAEAYAYCSKQGEDGQVKDSAAVDVGDKAAWGASQQGKRNDLREAVRTYVGEGAVSCAAKHTSQFVRYNQGIQLAANLLAPPVAIKSFEHPRPWQEFVLAELGHVPDDRTIHVVYDPKGGLGKSALVRHLIINYEADVVSGRSADAAFMIRERGSKVMVVDMTRAGSDFAANLQGVCESVKNGFIVSAKYASRNKILEPRHVIWLCNSLPDLSLWTEDRPYIHMLSPALDFEPGGGHAAAPASAYPPELIKYRRSVWYGPAVTPDCHGVKFAVGTAYDNINPDLPK